MSRQYDSRIDTLEHIARVNQLVTKAAWNLSQRAIDHDKSKLESPEKEAFDVATPKLAGLEYGSEEYKQSVRELGPALQHHFQNNRHHPEHYENGIRGMSLLDLIEMLCDWKVASERTNQRTDGQDYLKSSFADGLEYNQKRFGYSDELADIIYNTAIELDLL